MGERLTLEGFEELAADYDAGIERCADIDRFCSRSEWILPYHRAFLPHRELFLYRDGDSWVALAAREHPGIGRYLEAVENMWCFACPLVGRGAVSLLDEAIDEVGRERDAQPREGHRGRATLVLSGIPVSPGANGLLARLVSSLDTRYQLRAVDTTVRWVASLAGGLDGWLSRRSRSFRRNLRSAEKKALDAGLTFEPVAVTPANVGAVYRRILAVESASWKGAEGVGVDAGAMLAFYRDMLPRLAARGSLRVLVARVGERDVGYLHGAFVGDHFRGLQVSSDRGLARLSLGNLLQREIIEQLCREGIRTYDLGSRSDYKRRWAEEGLQTLTILARPR